VEISRLQRSASVSKGVVFMQIEVSVRSSRPARIQRWVIAMGFLCGASCGCCLWARRAFAQEEPAAITLPEPVLRVDAVYPPEALSNRQEGTVVLRVTVDVDGSVRDLEVAQSGGEALDRAAIDALRQWRFRPAQRGSEAVSARIRVPFRFELPLLGAEPPANAGTPAPDAGTAAGEALVSAPAADVPPRPSAPAAEAAQAAIDVTARGTRPLHVQNRSASDFTVEREILAAAPRQEGAEVLRTAPGLYVARSEGLAIGHRYVLRGFDADHGQDLELSVGGIPINMPSHVHGQGYADLGFLIAESVDELRATEGVYDPQQGDFAVAGSIAVQLGVEQRGWLIQSAYGSFGTFRQLLLWAPPGEDRQTFAAAQYQRSDGFGQNRQGQAASAIAQTLVGSGAWRYRALGILYQARADHAGVLRKDDIESGLVGFYDVYPDPSAREQNALATRVLTGLFGEYGGSGGDNAEIGIWLGLDDFRLQENFTGFIQRSQTLANVAGRGDLIEQQNRTRSLGVSARYRTSSYRPSSWARGTLELGFAGRVDDIDQAQNLLQAAVRNQTWDRRIDASILGADLGFWADLDARFAQRLTWRLGLRADALSYDVNDRLGNFAPLIRAQDTYIIGFRRSALGLAWGPRTSADLKLTDGLSIRAAYGEGYRSPQARTLEDGEDTPFSKVRGADLGVLASWSDRYRLTLSGYSTHLSDDVAFDAAEGSLQRVGETRRLGAVLYARARPVEWLLGAASVTYVDAQLLEPPPPTAQDPQPAFQRGENLPFVPPIVVRVDLGARPTLRDAVGGWPLKGKAGLGYSYLSPRPLPYGQLADPVSVLDASLGLGWGPFALGFDVFNVFDVRYAADEFSFPSDWHPEAPRPRTPALHTAAGAPRSWLLTLGLAL
jgi:TonB family protein